MTEAQTLALAFSRECLGWKDAYIYHCRDRCFIMARPYKTGEYRSIRKLVYSDLRSVMKYVRMWCDAKGYGIGIEYSPRNKAWSIWCNNETAWHIHDNLAAALMKACLEVVRND